MPDEKTEIQAIPGNFHFDYLSDERYLTSPSREAIEQLNLPELFITEAEKATRDLGIEAPVPIMVMIPTSQDDNYIIESLGIGAFTKHADKIIFQFDPSHPKIVESLQQWQDRQIAHEINHWARGDFYGEITLLNALIFEGLATNYEEGWGGANQETPWGHALDTEQLKTEWQKAKSELNSTNFDYSAWFFGTGDHPHWTGYTLGTAIVRKYRQLHPNEPMREIIKKPSLEILEQSRFG